MKKFFLGHAGGLAFSIAIIVCICLFVHVLALGSEYSSGINEQAAKRAEFYTLEQAHFIEDACDDMKREADYFAAKLSQCQTSGELWQTVKDFRVSGAGINEMLLDVFCFKGEELIRWDGEKITPYPDMQSIALAEETVLSRIFQYENRVMAIAASAKIDSPYADRVIIVFDSAALSLSDYAYDEKREQITCVAKSESTLLCKYDGKIIDRIENSKQFAAGSEAVQTGIINSLFTDKTTYNEVCAAMSDGEVRSFVFRDGTENYILTVNPFGKSDGNITLLCIYKVSNVYGDAYAINQNMWGSLLGLGLIMVVMVVSVIANRAASRKRIFSLEMIDPVLNCATPKKFEKNAEEILKRHTNTSFAFVSLKINNFGYISERFGDNASGELAKYCAGIIHHALLIEETFAYAGEGEFLLLMHYREKQAFSERLNSFYLRLSSIGGLSDKNYKISISFAVYEVEKDEKQSVKNMLDKLKIVKAASTVQVGSFSINFYEDMLRENYIRKAEIEGKMESALQNSEFHLFYQPKYNLRTKNIDGSEILIRWYDPKIESYRSPGEFLPVFEEDGFITKVDHFVFFKACENIAQRVANGKICYPISVNVSRVTAIQPDFLDYYIRIKEKFGISNNFITLEFTESFAYENYEFLSNIVGKLHENGILCSIDDFGTGYSSYNILKQIRMDEIKLDKFFLEKGISEERDQTLLKSVIEMVKKLGMKVTQEGVETREEFYRLETLGCDVIQGYYFTKPMKYVDYCEFIEMNFKKH